MAIKKPFNINDYSAYPEFKDYLTFLYKQVNEDGSKNLYLLHNDNFHILGILNNQGFRFPVVLDELKNEENLKSYYKVLKSQLSIGKGESVTFLQYRNYKYYPYKDEFHTALPVTSLKSKKVGDDIFLGKISFNDFVPNIISKNINGLIYVDTLKDRLLGFNCSFFRFFEHIYGDPKKMLSLPMFSFLSPTPLDIQKAHIAPFSLKEVKTFKTIYRKNFLKSGPGHSEEISETRSTRKTSEGLFFENQSNENLIITVLVPVNTYEYDFILSAQLNGIHRSIPFFVLGERLKGQEGLDENGYLAGKNPPADNMMLKKYGFITHISDISKSLDGELTFHFVKIANTLYVYENEECLISYFDNDFLKNKSAYLSVGIRPGDKIFLKNLHLSVKKTCLGKKHEQPAKLIVRLNNKRDNYFTLDRYYNYSLSWGPFNHVSGYMLTDVTEIRGKVISLGEKYKNQIKREKRLKSLLAKQESQNEVFIGSNRRIMEIKDTARPIASSDATVLIEGPTGSGKEVLAKYIHNNSRRKSGPFIKVDCSTIPKSLIESQLFGHEKGAFTGALSRSTGMFEEANHGTLFIDEVANLPMDMQIKLLQFFNDFSITTIGGVKPIYLDVRCIVASNVNLEKMIKTGIFREDLFYRINVVYLNLPPLKERIDDIPELCRHFLTYFSAVNNKDIRGISAETYKKLEAYDWPGNIRELKNVIQRAVIFCEGSIVTDDLILFSQRENDIVPITGEKKKGAGFRLSLTDRKYMIEVLKKYKGNVTEIANAFGITRAPLYKYFKKNKINVGNFRKGFEGLQD